MGDTVCATQAGVTGTYSDILDPIGGLMMTRSLSGASLQSKSMLRKARRQKLNKCADRFGLNEGNFQLTSCREVVISSFIDSKHHSRVWAEKVKKDHRTGGGTCAVHFLLQYQTAMPAGANYSDACPWQTPLQIQRLGDIHEQM
jgi:hypothetical protein